MQIGPGVEVWQNPLIKTGDYKIAYRVANMIEPSVTVKGWFIHRNTGRAQLPDKVINTANRDVPVAVLRIGQNGNITMLPAN
jgi:hypothetical protein